MDELGVRAIIIGVGIFVTLLVVTVIIMEISHISDIYKNVAQTDVSFEANFDELDKFRDSNNVFNELDVRNYIKKYAEEQTIEVCVNNNCNDESNLNNLNMYREEYAEYYSELISTNKGYKIIFYKK